MKKVIKKEDNFSLALGLFDYINPILYGITSFTIIKNMNTFINSPWNILYIIGAILSLVFGLAIPTVKCLVGLGKMKFKMPVNLVFYVNLGLFISGLTLLKNVFKINAYLMLIIIIAIILFLYLIYKKSNKFNTIAVLLGAFGYISIYASLISLAVINSITLSIVLYAIAICLFIFLCTIGIKANLKDARIHWLIETSNVLCQLLVAVSTIILFIK